MATGTEPASRSPFGRLGFASIKSPSVPTRLQTGMTAWKIPDTYTAMAWISNLAPP
jgi:hypothetical protein